MLVFTLTTKTPILGFFKKKERREFLMILEREEVVECFLFFSSFLLYTIK